MKRSRVIRFIVLAIILLVSGYYLYNFWRDYYLKEIWPKSVLSAKSEDQRKFEELYKKFYTAKKELAKVEYNCQLKKKELAVIEEILPFTKQLFSSVDINSKIAIGPTTYTQEQLKDDIQYREERYQALRQEVTSEENLRDRLIKLVSYNKNFIDIEKLRIDKSIERMATWPLNKKMMKENLEYQFRSAEIDVLCDDSNIRKATKDRYDHQVVERVQPRVNFAMDKDPNANIDKVIHQEFQKFREEMSGIKHTDFILECARDVFQEQLNNQPFQESKEEVEITKELIDWDSLKKEIIPATHWFDKMAPDIIQEGKSLYKKDDYNGAIAYFDKVLAVNPRNLDALNEKMISLLAREGNEVCGNLLKVCDQILDIDSNNFEVRKWLAHYWTYQARRADIAIKACNKLLSIDPKNSEGLKCKLDALIMKGVSLFRKGNFSEAIVQFNEAITINPKSVSALTKKGICIVCVGDYHSALELFSKALAIDSNCNEANVSKGNILLLINFWDNNKEASALFDKVLTNSTNKDLIELAGKGKKRILNPPTTYEQWSLGFIMVPDIEEAPDSFVEDYWVPRYWYLKSKYYQ